MEFVLKSGAVLVVSPSPFEIGNELRKSFIRAAQQEINPIADNEIERIFFLCSQKAIYKGIKVNKALFDDPQLSEQARGDYNEIFEKVLEVNLSPFFPKVSSESGQPSTAKARDLK